MRSGGMAKIVIPRGLRCSFCDQVISTKDQAVKYQGALFCDRQCLLSEVLSESDDVEVAQ
jgi:hypothetical protein